MSQSTPTANEKIEAAVAYALWDTFHTEKMIDPDDVNAHILYAQGFREWLRKNGYTITKIRKRK